MFGDDFKNMFKDMFIEKSTTPVDLSPIYAELLPEYKKLQQSDQRFILISGGRGSAKSSQVADMMLIDSFNESLANTQFLCFREYHASMKGSVYGVLSKRIKHYDLSDYFKIMKTEIINLKTGITFVFEGLQNPESIKSMSTVSRGWGEEAQKFKMQALEDVIPSIRGDGKIDVKIYFTYNPKKSIDDIKAYVGRQNKKELLHINIFDLPKDYQNFIMLEEAERDKVYNPDYYTHKWLGQPHPSRALEPFMHIDISEEYKPPSGGNVYGFIDPSFTGGDYTAISVCWVSHDQRIYVYGRCFKRAWNECVNECIQIYRDFGIDYFFYEDNSLGTIPRDIYADSGVHITPHTSKGNKVNRIYKVAPIAGALTLVDKSDTFTFNKQIANYTADISKKPKEGEHDDAPDSLASCLMKMKII